MNPYEEGGVVIAIEITLGAAVAGPFDIDKAALEAMIARVLSTACSALVLYGALTKSDPLTFRVTGLLAPGRRPPAR